MSHCQSSAADLFCQAAPANSSPSPASVDRCKGLQNGASPSILLLISTWAFSRSISHTILTSQQHIILMASCFLAHACLLQSELEPVAQEVHSQELSEATDQTEKKKTEVSEKLQTINAMEILLDHSVKHARSKKCCSTCARPLNPSEMQSFMHKLVSLQLSHSKVLTWTPQHELA